MRFSIRDVLWLMVVVALGLAWWADHRRQAHVEQKFRVVDRMLQHKVNLYYADTGRHLVLNEDLTDLHYRPTNVKTAASP
jgi:hypothetical protein